MKRTLVIHCFISLILGVAIGNFLLQTIFHSEIHAIVFLIMSIIAFVLNIVCGYDKDDKE